MTYLIIITYDNTDPQAFGPYATEIEAGTVRQRMEAAMTEDQYRHVTNISTARLQASKA